ncbi:TetR/AcrR family transcriptional regulator [Alteromonas sp. M12]|uniref:TetR/AcrR family transcriptional regulator n=1 Tax=Alteromonas sp. M12 TaxID=3135644 RepID=UPI00319D992A
MALSRTKQLQRNKIINVAKQMFLDQGIVLTSMTDITKSAKIDRKTLYNYFSNKEELATAILEDLKKNSTIMKNTQSYQGDSGFETLTQYFTILFDTLQNNKESVLYTIHFDYFSEEQTYFVGAKNLNELKETPLYKILKAGVDDNSINNFGLSMSKLMGVVFTPFYTTAQQLCRREKVYKEVYDIEFSDLKVYIKILLAGLKNN